MTNSILAQRKRKHAIQILETLDQAGHKARLAGGCVRDRLLAIEPKDYDIASTATPEQVQKVFTDLGYKVIPTGLEHGTVTLITKSGPVEVTTLRKDVKTDGRRAEVSFVEDFKQDALRRDFTINAMSEDAEGNLYDYFSGQQDLTDQKIRFVGDASTRIQEDYLRIMRFFRFMARFNLNADQYTIQAIQLHKQGLESISQERVTSELLLLLDSLHIKPSLKLMFSTGILKWILHPEVEDYPQNIFEQTLPKMEALTTPQIANNNLSLGLCRLAIILTQLSLAKNSVANFCQRLKLSKKQKDFVIFCCQAPTLVKNLEQSNQAKKMEFIDNSEKACGANSFLEIMLPIIEQNLDTGHSQIVSELKSIERTKGHLRRSTLPISGNDLIDAFKLEPGNLLGSLLRDLKESYRREEWSSQEDGMKLAKKILTKQ